MLSDKDKQTILDGAYGITKNGYCAKYIGEYESFIQVIPEQYVAYRFKNTAND